MNSKVTKNSHLEEPLQVLAFGGGIQSTALLCMVFDGLYKAPDVVIFADTGSELPSTYATVEAMEALCREHGIEFIRVYARVEEFEEGIALHDYYQQKTTWPHMPMVRNPQCTFKFKIYPIRRAIKAHPLYNSVMTKPRCSTWLGITTDELNRKRKSDLQWVENKYPLLDLDLSRRECEAYVREKYPQLNVSKSGCFVCPYAPPREYVRLKKEHPNLFEIAVQLERQAKEKGHKGGLVAGKTIEAFNSTISLEQFGFEFAPEDISCESSSAGCFL